MVLLYLQKNEASHKFLSQQFENRETTKIYNGLVLGQPLETSGVINEPISEHPSKKGMMSVYKKGKESITEFEVLESFRLFSWIKFKILTGRTHQIRVHMKFLGNPIACDPLYGDGKPVFISQLKSRYKLSQSEEEERPLLNRWINILAGEMISMKHRVVMLTFRLLLMKTGKWLRCMI